MDKLWTKEPTIILGIDIGTTCSAVSFIHLTAGKKPEVQRVTAWPGQIDSEKQCKLPSLVWYNTEGKPVSYGTEAFNQDSKDAADQGLQLAKHFKLHLHPSDMAPSSGFKLDPLPRGVSVDQVYADFLRYLFQHTKGFFEEHIFNGQEIWDSLSASMSIMIAHPNGWSIYEQKVLRSAAVAAGISTDSESHQKIIFVSEAEASVQFCLRSSELVASLEPGMNLIVCDAGGSTVDTTVYTVTANDPLLKLEEIKGSACIQAGAIFVDEAVECYLSQQLGSTEDLDEGEVESHVKDGLEEFINFTKPNFDGTEGILNIKVGKRKLNMPSINISGGRMKLAGSIVKSAFDGCVGRILDSIASQASGVVSPYFFLVGGFGDSPYLKTALKNQISRSGRLNTSNSPGAKAVADGAAIWSITRSVVGRATRHSYGTEVIQPFNVHDAEHRRRGMVLLPSGHCAIEYGWSQIVGKDTVMAHDSSVTKSYGFQTYSLASSLSKIEETIYMTDMPASSMFMRDEEGALYPKWTPACVVTANIRDLSGILVERYSPLTGPYWTLECEIGIRFGGTELEAYIEWTTNGETMTGPASIIPAGLI